MAAIGGNVLIEMGDVEREREQVISAPATPVK